MKIKIQGHFLSFIEQIKHKVEKKAFFLVFLVVFHNFPALAHPMQSDTALLIMQSVYNPSNINYINLNEISDETLQKSLSAISDNVINDNAKYLLDFSQLEDNDKIEHYQKQIQSRIGMSIFTSFLAITNYQGSMLFTPISDSLDPQIQRLNEDNSRPRSRRKRRSVQKISPPKLSFYVSLNKQFSESDCLFPRVTPWLDTQPAQSFYCSSSANISLIFQVEFLRSLKNEKDQLNVPDKKLVRISFYEELGAGFHLNDSFGQVMDTSNPTTTLIHGWSDIHGYSAIAKSYTINIIGQSDLQILEKRPATNIQSNYSHREVSNFSIGVSSNLSNPKEALSITGTHTEGRWFSYNTTDYKVNISTPNPTTFSVSWIRDQYDTADSLIERRTSAILPGLDLETFINPKNVKEVGYKNFTPQMSVTYGVDAHKQGYSYILVDANVEYSPVYVGRFLEGGWYYSYNGFVAQTKTASVAKLIGVDWSHPVFTGRRPVSLQLGIFNNRCLSRDKENRLSVNECNLHDFDRLFIYDGFKRYISASNQHLCLDGASIGLVTLEPCSQALSQKWEWENHRLKNLFQNRYLTHDKRSTGLFLTQEVSSKRRSQLLFTTHSPLY
ncbi:leukocidin family pore-forming toxin [Vibrio caribbeanicus]|uniref:leukocidin family pore-forming toxin n=1 Tax=Vibrio caribbeanicus TaxID=701175 RepID=UPI0030DB302A